MKSPTPMKSLALIFLATWHLPTAADTGMAAPSTLPGQNTPVQIQETPPVALPMPVVKPKASTPDYPPTDMENSMGGNPDFLNARKPKSKAEVLREQESSGMGASNISAPAEPMQPRPSLTPNTGTAPLLPEGLRTPSAKL